MIGGVGNDTESAVLIEIHMNSTGKQYPPSCARVTSSKLLPSSSSSQDGEHDLSEKRSPSRTVIQAEVDHQLYTNFIQQQRQRLSANLRIREALLQHHLELASATVTKELAKVGLEAPRQCPSSEMDDDKCTFFIDRNKQRVYSEFLRRSKMPLPAFARLIRGESVDNPRPNKALEVPHHLDAWSTYPHKDKWMAIVRNGVVPQWKGDFAPQATPPRNHPSALRALNVLTKNTRRGQDAQQYLVLDLDLLGYLDGIFCSPFGAVEKEQVDLGTDGRFIHDLSYPETTSVNVLTDTVDTIEITYDGAREMASQALDVLNQHPGRTRMMSGDASGAFRHIPHNADHVGRFAGTVPELGILVIDLAPSDGRTHPQSIRWLARLSIISNVTLTSMDSTACLLSSSIRLESMV